MFLIWYSDNTIVCGLCCSTLSAVFLAAVLDIKDYQDKRKEILKGRKIYFKFIKNEIEDIISKVFWLDILFDEDDYVLDKDSEEFNSLNFMIYIAENYKHVNINFSYDELKNKFLKLEEKYNLKSLEKMNISKRTRVNKIFHSISKYSKHLINELYKLEQNKILLDFLGYSTIEEIDNLNINIFRFYEICSANDKDFGAAIKLLFISLDMIRKMGDFTNDFSFHPTTKCRLKDL